MNHGQFFERLEGEPDTAYSAFCVYRDMGITRSLRKAAHVFYADRDSQEATGEPPESGTGSQLTRLKRWSRAWLWTARAEAFDGEEARERSLALKARRIKMADFHYSLGMLALQRVAERLRNMALDEELPTRSLAQIMRAAADLQRLSVGESTVVADLRTARHPEEHPALDVSRLSVEDKEELARIAGYLKEDDYLDDEGLDFDQGP